MAFKVNILLPHRCIYLALVVPTLSLSPSHSFWTAGSFPFPNNLYLFYYPPSFVFQDTVSLCSPGCSRTYYVDRLAFNLQRSSASASQKLRLMVYVSTLGLLLAIFNAREASSKFKVSQGLHCSSVMQGLCLALEMFPIWSSVLQKTRRLTVTLWVKLLSLVSWE